jgi:hypothetical protein
MHASRHIQSQVPADIHRRLHDLAYDSHRSVSELLLDAVLLLLRLHSRADGLPEPRLPGGAR